MNTPVSETEILQSIKDNMRLFKYISFSMLKGLKGIDVNEESNEIIQTASNNVVQQIRKGTTIQYPKAYLSETVKNLCINRIKKNKREAKIIEFSDPDLIQLSSPKLDQKEIWVTDPDTTDNILIQLPPVQRSDFIAKYIDKRSYSEIAEETKRKEEAIRQSCCAGFKKIQIYLALHWLRTGEYARFNQPRITEKTACAIAQLCRNDPRLINQIKEGFAHKELNRAIQNSTWILAHLYERDDPRRLQIENFFRNQLANGELYRGNKTYISEALIDMDERHITEVKSNFILRLEDFDDRVTRQNVAKEEAKEIGDFCIYDVKKVHPIGKQMKDSEVKYILKRFLSGKGSIDERRCMTYQLYRCHINNEEIINAMMDSLPDEGDPTNAYYSIKYYRNWLEVDHPGAINHKLIDVLNDVCNRFPQTQFILDTQKYFEKKLYYRH